MSSATLVVDIESSSVGACIVSTNNDVHTVSDVYRVQLGSGEYRDAAAMRPLLGEALKSLLKNYASSGARTVHVAVSSPWFTAATRVVESSSERPVRVTRHTIDRALASSEPMPGAQIERLATTVRVNGYPTEVSHSVLGTKLSVSVYESHTDQAVLDTITSTIEGVLPHAKLEFHTLPVMIARRVGQHAFVARMSGEQTDLVLTGEAPIEVVASIPIGSRTIERAVAQSLTGSVEDAASRLMMLDGSLPDADRVKAVSALTAAAAPFQTAFQSFVAAQNRTPVPHTITTIGAPGWMSHAMPESTSLHPLQNTFGDTFIFAEGAVADIPLLLIASVLY